MRPTGEPAPPRLHEALLRRVLPADVRGESVVGDLREEYLERLESRAPAAARRWYRRQVRAVVVRMLLRRRGRRSPARSERGDPTMTVLVRDVRYAVRNHVRTPGFTAVALLTVALGVGVNTAVFSVVNGVLLRPLPYPEADRIVCPWAEKVFSTAMLVQFREHTRSFSDVAAYSGEGFTLLHGDEPEVVGGALVTPDYFRVIGVQPAVGRGFVDEDGAPGAEPVVILSHRLWQRSFGGDPALVGRAVPIEGEDGTPRTVVGILPRDYAGLGGGWDLWVPLSIDPAAPAAGRYGYRVLARLADNVTLDEARADVARLVPLFEVEHPTQFRPVRRSPVPVLSLHATMVGNVRGTLLLLLGAVVFVLLIACANVANLLLARATARDRELAVRVALGASRSRLIRQLLTESTVLGLAGGALAVVAVVATHRAILTLVPPGLPRAGAIGIDPTVLAFAVGVSLVAGILFGVLPALRSTHATVESRLRDSGRAGTGGRGRNRLNHSLVVTEVAMAVVLVVGAGLMVKSMQRLRSVDVGFAAEGLVTFLPMPPASRYASRDDLREYAERVRERVRALPSVRGVATINRLPMTGGNVGIPYLVEGQEPPPGSFSQVINVRGVNVDYFATLGIPLLAGRLLETSDGPDTEIVGVVNRAAAELHWPGESAVGQRLLTTDGDPLLTVVGVVANIQQHQLDLAPRPQVYMSESQAGTSARPFYLVRTDGDPAALLPAIREAVRSVDARVPIVQQRTMAAVIEESLGNARFFASLLFAFAALALSLGAVGVYGVMAYVTGQRSRELGIRVALGATRPQLLRTTLGRALLPVLAGIGLGLAAATALTRIMSGLLFEVAPTDPLVFGSVALILLTVGATAAYLPARRASRVDPIAVLGES